MPKYKVTVREYLVETRTYELMAETPEAAEELATEMAIDDDNDPEFEGVESREAEAELIPEPTVAT